MTNFTTYLTSFYSYILSFYLKIFSLISVKFTITVLLILAIDSLLLDDEPLWEPLEWSVIQTWILYIYLFTWVSEVIFSSRYGSYSNRDKVVWIGLFRTYYGLIIWFVINIVIVTVFVTLPFYFEITYMISYSVVWWNWISSAFFFKIFSTLMVILGLLNILRFQLRWLSYFQLQITVLAIFIILVYIFFFQAITTWLGFWTNVNEFQDSGWSELSRITNGPLKWGWGSEARDHFAYHKTTSVFWAKNDQLVLSSLLFFNIFLFLFLFFLLLQVMSYFWVISYSAEISFNGLTFLFSTVQHFAYLIFYLSALVLLSLIYQFIRFPVEFFYYIKFIQLFQLEGELIYDLIKKVF